MSENAEVLAQVDAFFASSAGVETTATRPVLRMTMSSATSKTSFGFCSTSTIDSPLSFSLRMVAITSATICGARPFRRLVHQQHARIAHQRAADRQHLLLAAGQMRGDLLVPLMQTRKHGEHRVRGPRRVLAAGIRLARGDHQVLAHGQALEDAAALRHQRHAARRDHLRRQAR